MTWVFTPWQTVDYIVLAIALGLLLIHWAWCSYLAYPMELEKQLKSGKSWVYVPLHWTKGRKFSLALVTRLLLAATSAGQIGVLHHFFPFPHWGVAAGAFIVTLLVLWRLQRFWVMRRYKQEEDVYFRMHDQLRDKLSQEGKFPAEMAFKSLATYQFQMYLRKADEAGNFLSALKREKKSAQGQNNLPQLEAV